MALSKDRKGELAFIFLKATLEDKGVELKPKEVKRSVKNMSKNLGISSAEAAEFILEMTKEIYDDTVKELQVLLEIEVK